jgi:hypothetical protein
MNCECEDWKENIPKVNGHVFLAVARNPNTEKGYTGKQFIYCPWCGKKLEEINVRKNS